jgi:hypothetical protein
MERKTERRMERKMEENVEIKTRREEILQLIAMCKEMVEKGIDPFKFNVKEALETLKRFEHRSFDDLNLDGQTIAAIVGIVKSQESWIKNRINSVFIDPLLVDLMIRTMGKDELTEKILKCYHPIASIETITGGRLKEAIDYWNNLLPFEERKIKFNQLDDAIELLDVEKLIEMRIYAKDEFEKSIGLMKEELDGVDKTDYFDFVMGDGRSYSYEACLKRGYILAFLISQNFVSLSIDPLRDEIKIVKGNKNKKNKKVKSIAIPINYDLWMEHAQWTKKRTSLKF